jgi:outer membrane protein assembly factor BamB
MARPHGGTATDAPTMRPRPPLADARSETTRSNPAPEGGRTTDASSDGSISSLDGAAETARDATPVCPALPPSAGTTAWAATVPAPRSPALGGYVIGDDSTLLYEATVEHYAANGLLEGTRKLPLGLSYALAFAREPDGSGLLAFIPDYSFSQQQPDAGSYSFPSLAITYVSADGALGDTIMRGKGVMSNAHVAMDASQVAIAAVFARTGDVRFADSSEAHFTLTPGGLTAGDVLFAETTRSGTLLWAKQAGSGAPDLARDVGLCGDGSVFVSGYSWGLMTFEPGLPTEHVLTRPGSRILARDTFLARYALSGQMVWATETPDTYGAAIAVLDDCSVVQIGTGEAPKGVHIPFGHEQPGALEMTMTGFENAFVVRFSPNGSAQWLDGIDGDGFVRGIAGSRAPDGTVYVGGTFTKSARFGKNQCRDTTLVAPPVDSPTIDSVFVARYTASGKLIWVRKMDPISGDSSLVSVSAASDGVVVVGTLDGALTLPGDDVAPLRAPDGRALFVVKLRE